jgi:hypothetical protein
MPLQTLLMGCVPYLYLHWACSGLLNAQVNARAPPNSSSPSSMELPWNRWQDCTKRHRMKMNSLGSPALCRASAHGASDANQAKHSTAAMTPHSTTQLVAKRHLERSAERPAGATVAPSMPIAGGGACHAHPPRHVAKPLGTQLVHVRSQCPMALITQSCRHTQLCATRPPPTQQVPHAHPHAHLNAPAARQT